MPSTKIFGTVLARVRAEQGFRSAHAFYKLRDGRRSFKMTFRNYLNVEQGKNIPKPGRVEAIIAALGLEAHGAAAAELAAAYARALGLGGLLGLLRAGAPAAAQDDDAALLEEAARRTLREKTAHLSREQWRVLAADFDAYACDDLLQMSAGGLALPELARLTGLTPKAVRRAVAALSAAGLVKAAGGRARSAYEGKSVESAPRDASWAGIHAGLLAHQARLAEGGALIHSSVNKTRLTPADLQSLRRRVDQLILMSGLYEKLEPGNDSDVYMLRAQVHRVFPRKP